MLHNFFASEGLWVVFILQVWRLCVRPGSGTCSWNLCTSHGSCSEADATSLCTWNSQCVASNAGKLPLLFESYKLLIRKFDFCRAAVALTCPPVSNKSGCWYKLCCRVVQSGRCDMAACWASNTLLLFARYLNLTWTCCHVLMWSICLFSLPLWYSIDMTSHIGMGYAMRFDSQ